MPAQTFTEAVDTFLKSAESWLTDDDAPAVAALVGAARSLDGEITPALLSAYGLTYRNLLRRKPPVEAEPDELEQLLNTTDQPRDLMTTSDG